MKKTYEKPELRTEPFDAGDVITLSDPANPAQKLLNQVGDLFENVIDMLGSMGS
ncbi:MAG: hypothetical protein IJT41_05940 [Clostridia bacterium]|nr:hypothetical protein [Clostridia bacterium]